MRDPRALLDRELDGQFHRKQAEQRREFDNRIHRNRRGVLEGIADGIANDGRRMQRRAFFLQLDFNDFLSIIPSSAAVCHENRLEQPKQGDRNQVTDKEIGFDEGKGQRREEHGQENIEHAALRIQSANLHHALAVGHRRLLHALELDIGLDEFHRSIRAGRHGLSGGAGKPVDHRPAGDEAEQEGRVQHRKVFEIFGQPRRQHHDDGKNHRRRPDDRRADQHRLGRGFERVAGAVIFLEQVFGRGEIGREPVAVPEFLLHARNVLDERQLEDRLRVVGHRSVRVDGNRHRSHPQKSERDQTERKYRRRLHQRGERGAHGVGNAHQSGDHEAEPVRAEVAGDQPGKDVQRRAAFTR